ncbi:hypothetical protein ACPOLB_03810 [Rubrivivax sp. RP6-9]|uniref:hypothetical protein n=1 Tax=Rubrivivax sp. RP6-9 TaxID=3415750 RepID=UPI003CC53B7F
MAPSSRDRLSVDLHGLKAALVERARLAGTSPSGWVRATLAEALTGPAEPAGEARIPRLQARVASRVRLTLRMSRAQASAVLAAARMAGQPPGDFIADLLAGRPVLMPASERAETLGALIAACAELSTFSRNLSHLVSLLRQGAFRPAEECRPMLTTLSIDVREHLDHLTRALVELQPRRGSGMQQRRSGPAQPGARS